MKNYLSKPYQLRYVYLDQYYNGIRWEEPVKRSEAIYFDSIEEAVKMYNYTIQREYKLFEDTKRREGRYVSLQLRQLTKTDKGDRYKNIKSHKFEYHNREMYSFYKVKEWKPIQLIKKLNNGDYYIVDIEEEEEND